MKRVFVFVPLCAMFGAMGHSSDDVAVIDELFQKSHATVVQLRELFEIRRAVLYKCSSMPRTDDVNVYPAYKESSMPASLLQANNCKPLESSFRNYFEVFRLAESVSPIREDSKLTLVSLQTEITGLFSEFCKIFDSNSVWYKQQ
jgi:hypothetical protein